MKYYKYFVVLLALLLTLSTSLMAQEEKEMTEDEWQNEINRLTQQKADLGKELESLQNDVNGMKTKMQGMQDYDACVSENYDMVGATKADVDAYRNKVNALEGQIKRQESPKEDRQAALDALKGSKISALPEFYSTVHTRLQNLLDAWQEKPKEIMYTVIKGDYLWKIAKNPSHYGNGFAWPKIYKANRDQIKNPDLIYPKQIFKIPNLTEDEQAHYSKLRKTYKPAPEQ